ncbi:MAG: hypothetical protein AAFR58_25795 [Cyanobacteria bacterium J06627_28]
MNRSSFFRGQFLGIVAAGLGVFLCSQPNAVAAGTASSPTYEVSENVHIAQSNWNNVLSRLNTHIDENYSYFDNYALNAANAIAEGERVNWHAARMDMGEDNGKVLLRLFGNVVVTGFASLFVTPPQIELHVLFSPDECFQYSFTDYQVGASGSFASTIENEVGTLLAQERNRSAMESSINNAIYQSMSSLQLLGAVGCY